ncbi:microtubule-associated protein 70-1-like [Rutidosis leptorrhynchoides]|uniref:microtubule-associated protein 70-1-like n=1 Tax=Rutidosis leptorrhynchoides TaxID=125765 RepID=UPI003A9911B1
MASYIATANGEAAELAGKPTTSFSSLKTRKPKPNNNGNCNNNNNGISYADDVITLLHGSNPVRVELNRLENELRDKDRELGEAQAEIKSLKNSERLKEKAVEELTDELNKVDEKLKATEALLESKNLEIKKTNEEKKAALAAQFAAEATLRRVHAAQNDDEMPPIEAIITPLEAELKLAKLEAAKLQEDNRALDRFTKSKEAALIEAEKTVQLAMAKAAFVDDLQNKNQDLMKQIEICQEENRILDKMHRQKVAEVEKLMQTVRELEEAVLAGGAAANAVRDYQRKVQEMNEERKTLECEVARAKVSANRVATVVANEWKDGNDKVMPVKQWLEERKHFQGELQKLRDKLAVADRAAKAEAQLKEKYILRFKVMEEKLRSSNENSHAASEKKSPIYNGSLRRQSLGGAESFSKPFVNGFALKKTNKVLARDAKRSSFDGGSLAPDNDKLITEAPEKEETIIPTSVINGKPDHQKEADLEDYVSGILYDMLQKEVVTLRKAFHEKDLSLKDKDDAIEMLAKKVETLNKAMEVEGKKMRREMAAMEKEFAAMRVSSKELDQRTRRTSASRTGSHFLYSSLTTIDFSCDKPLKLNTGNTARKKENGKNLRRSGGDNAEVTTVNIRLSGLMI